MKWLRRVGIGLLVVILVVAGLVGFAAATALGRLKFEAEPSPRLVASKDPALIERGRYLVHGPAHCAECHSSDDRDHPEKVRTAPLSGGLPFEMGPLGTRYARNLTPHPTAGIGQHGDAALARTLRTGVLPDGELSFFMSLSASNLSDQDLVAVMSYLRSLAPIEHPVPPGHWDTFGKVLLTYAFPPLEPRRKPAPKHVAPSDTPSIESGEYLANHVMLCTACHTKFDMSTFQPFGPVAGGSLPEPSHGNDSDMEFVAPNLTSHPTGMTGRMPEDAFVARLRGGRVHASSIMPWECFQDTTEVDLRSVYRYLQSLPKVDNDVGPTYRKVGWKAGQ